MNVILKYFVFAVFVYYLQAQDDVYDYVKPTYKKLGGSFIFINGGLMYKNGFGNRDTSIVKVAPFIVSDHKVTNKEYRDIMLWARDNSLEKSLDLLVPDYSTISEAYERYGINCDVLTNYFLDPRYDNYPVVGLKYEQIIEFLKLKSKKDKVKYRLMNEDEFDFLVNEVKNVNINGDLRILQNNLFDDSIKKQIARDNELSDVTALDFKTPKSTKNGARFLCWKTDKSLCGGKKKKVKKVVSRSLALYNPVNYYNLRLNSFSLNEANPFYSDVYRYLPNEFLVYDLIGNLYEITFSHKDISEFNVSDFNDYYFVLCGGSCFDYYEDIASNIPKFFDTYDAIRCDRGFRLVRDL